MKNTWLFVGLLVIAAFSAVVYATDYYGLCAYGGSQTTDSGDVPVPGTNLGFRRVKTEYFNDSIDNSFESQWPVSLHWDASAIRIEDTLYEFPIDANGNRTGGYVVVPVPPPGGNSYGRLICLSGC